MSTLATFVQAFSIFAVCWGIISGIEQWRREFIGKRQIEIAEQALEIFYEVKDAVRFIRNPWLRNGEGDTREKAEGETEEETKLLNKGYIAIERYAKREDTFVKFQSMKYKYMASFGSDKEDIFTSLAIEINKIFTVSHSLATIYWKKSQYDFAMSQGMTNFLDDKTTFERILWELEPEKDPFVPIIQKAQERLEEVVRSCSRETTDSYRWLTLPLRKLFKKF